MLITCIAGGAFADVNVSLGGLLELAYDSDSKLYTSEDSEIVISAEANDKISGELVWKNNALDAYGITYKLKEDLSISAGLLGVHYGEYYTHLVSDPMLKDSFDLTQAGWAVQCDKWGISKTLGIFNNTDAVNPKADAVALRVAVPVGDSKVGAGYLKDGREDIAVNYFGEGVWGKYTVDAELAAKKNDRWAAFGFAYSLSDLTEIAARYESNIVSNTHFTVSAIGLSQVIDEYITVAFEAKTTSEENKNNSHLFAKTSLEF